jgi:hypothetical protein
MNDLRSLAARAAGAAREHATASLREALARLRGRLGRLWDRRPSARRAVALAFAAALTIVGTWSIFTQARLPRRLPSALDWAAARALLERDARPGDAVALAPPWAERAREVLPAAVPVLTHDRYAREELVGARRVWLVGLRRSPYHGWDQALDLVERASRSGPPARLGMLEVTRHDLAFPSLPLAFLPDRLAQATVTLGDVPCEATGPSRFRCGGGAVVLERALRDVGGVPRPCLSARSDAALGAPLLVAFPAGRIGRTLVGHAASPGPASPVRVAVVLDGEEVGAAELAGGAAWSQFRVDMTRSAGQARALSLILTSPGPLAVCLDAAVMP